MRELANLSTQEALAAYSQRHSAGKATGKLLVGLVLGLAGAGLVIWRPFEPDFAFYGGLCALAVAFVSTSMGVFSAVRASRSLFLIPATDEPDEDET